MINRGRERDRFLATILFTDIVGSTDMAAKIGDKEWRRLLAAHNNRVRTQLKRFGGRELDTAGDGFLCSFEQPAQAVRAADAILAEVAPLGVTLRAGIHTGEAERIGGGKLGGIAVHIAARIMAAADGGQVLVSSTVRDLVSGSRLGFTDAGSRELKGVPGEWHLYQLVREMPAAIEATLPLTIAESADEARARRQRNVILVAVAALGLIVLLGAGVAFALLGGGARPAAVGDPGPDTVVTIDTSSAKIIDVHPVQAGPVAIALDPASGRLWVASLEAGVVTDFATTGPPADRSTGRVGRPTDIAIGGGNIWVADALDETVTIIDAATGEVRRTVADVVARRLVYGFGSAWATDDITDRVLRLDAQSGDVAQAVELGAGAYPIGIAATAEDALEQAIWVANEGLSTVVRIDPSSSTITQSGIALGAVPENVIASGDAIWIAGRDGDLVLRVDPSTNSLSQTIPICDQPFSLAEESGVLWVGCAGASQLWQLQADGSDPKMIEMGGVPSDIAVGNGRLYVTVRKL